MPRNSSKKDSEVIYSFPSKPSIDSYYGYQTPSYEEKTVSTENKRKYNLKTVEFPLQLPPELDYQINKNYETIRKHIDKSDQDDLNDLQLLKFNRIDYYSPVNLPAGTRAPAILISPILGGNMVVDHFARYYAKRGFVAAIVHRKEVYWSDNQDIDQIERYLRTSIIRIRQALDWIMTQPEVDTERIGAFGISYGAIVHSILAAVDDRIDYHILALAAAPLADVIVDCPDRQIRRLIPKIKAKYGDDIDQIHRLLQQTIHTDPINLASTINPDNMTFYIALLDRIVGTKRSFALWRAFDRPHLKVLPFGHYGGVLILPILQYQTYKIFQRELRYK